MRFVGVAFCGLCIISFSACWPNAEEQQKLDAAKKAKYDSLFGVFPKTDTTATSIP